jgi:hypothetical protein
VTVLFRARLRIDADFGQACDPTFANCFRQDDRTRTDQWVPGYTPRSIDLTYAYLDVLNLGRGLADLRFGRMLLTDALGFFLLDGARARMHLTDYVVAEAIAGFETRSGYALSSGRFDRDGIIHADRGGWDPSLAPYVVDRALAPTVGVALETGTAFPVFARLAYRRVWTDAGISEEKIGGTVNVSLFPTFRLSGEAVWSVPQQILSNVLATAEYHSRVGLRIALDYQRWRPTFDLSSIWVAFWTDPTDLLQARTEIPLTRALSLTATGLVRRYALSESGPINEGAALSDEWDAGGSGGLALRTPAYRASLRGTFEGGQAGYLGGCDLSGSWAVWAEFVRLEARLSLWQVEQSMHPDRAGISFGAVLGTTIRLGAIADLHADIEDDVNRFVGQRFRAMGYLSLRGGL